MTSAERLKEIENKNLEAQKVSKQLVQPEKSWLKSMEEIEWLIARVKKLTEALEYYGDIESNMTAPGDNFTADGGLAARKALEGDE